MQQPDSQEISLPDQSVLAKLEENWRIIIVILLIFAIIMIIAIGVYYATSLDDKKDMIIGLVILFSCIPLGIVCTCGAFFFVRWLRSLRNPSSDQEVPSSTSRQVPASINPEAVIPSPAPCDRQKNFERRTLQGGMDRFINRSRSHRRPADISDSDAVELEHRATRDSPNYIFRQTDRTSYGFDSSGSTDHSRFDVKDHNWQRARPIDNSSTEVKGYCRDMNRRELEEKQLWSRRNKHKGKNGQDNFSMVNELESSSDELSKNRTKARSRSETRDYRNKPNKNLRNLYLSTRRTNEINTGRNKMYSSKEKMEMKNYENRGKITEHVSRKKSHRNEYLYETDKITRGSQKVFCNEVNGCAEINRSARYPETSSEYPYIRPQTTEPTNHRQFWQRQSYFPPPSSSERKTMSYPLITSSKSNMEASQYACYNSRNAYANIPKCNTDLQYSFTPESRQMYMPKERGNIKVQHPLSRYETVSTNVPQHSQYLLDSRSHQVQSPVSTSKEYAKYLNTYRETNNYPSFDGNASRYSSSIEEQDYDASLRKIQRAKSSIEEQGYDPSQRQIQDSSSINNIETYGHQWKSTAEPRSNSSCRFNSNGQYAFKNKEKMYPPL